MKFPKVFWDIARNCAEDPAAEHMAELLDKLGICGCSNDGTWLLIRDILATINEDPCYRNPDKPYPPYSHATAQASRICDLLGVDHSEADGDWPATYYIAMAVLDKAGLIEHGGGIRNSWLTDEGLEVLTYLKENADKDDEP